MTKNIAVIKGDGIGPEIVGNAVRVLEEIGRQYGHTFTFNSYLAGGCAIDACGTPLPQETIDGCLASDSILLGAVGGPKWDGLSGEIRPEKALLGIRAAMGLFTNLRPAKLYPALKGECPLREDNRPNQNCLALRLAVLFGLALDFVNTNQKDRCDYFRYSPPKPL